MLYVHLFAKDGSQPGCTMAVASLCNKAHVEAQRVDKQGEKLQFVHFLSRAVLMSANTLSIAASPLMLAMGTLLLV